MSFFDYNVYDIPDATEIETIKPESSVVIVVEEHSYNEIQADLLGKILKSVGQDIFSAQMVQVPRDRHLKFDEDSENSVLIISFGIPPMQCCLQVEEMLYSIIKLSNRTFLFSRSLDDLPDVPEDRRALWDALKLYFNKT